MTIEIGKKFSVSEIVTPAIVASTFGSGALPVFATPYLIALMEHAAFACLQELLDEGQGSVGTHLNVSHESPTPIGMTVRA
ncbi:MAG: dihydrolipoamide acyltransferase, partial [Ruthenibacterium sp.]